MKTEMLCPEGHPIKETINIGGGLPAFPPGIFADPVAMEHRKILLDSRDRFKCLMCKASGNEIGFKWFTKDQCIAREVGGE